ncbi:MAG: hypothetical protein ACE5OZ_20555 [Candidatus Heimdallarchaeota archaeon]
MITSTAGPETVEGHAFGTHQIELNYVRGWSIAVDGDDNVILVGNAYFEDFNSSDFPVKIVALGALKSFFEGGESFSIFRK